MLRANSEKDEVAGLVGYFDSETTVAPNWAATACVIRKLRVSGSTSDADVGFDLSPYVSVHAFASCSR